MPVELTRPPETQHGDYATNVALRLAGERRQPPREVADELAATIRALDGVASVEVAGPGFLNLTVDDAWLGQSLGGDRRRRARRSAAARPRRASGSRSSSSRRTRQGRSPSPRRGTAPTATRSRALLAFAGHEVEREYYYNDAGAQMDKFRESVEAVRRGEEPPEDGYRGEYIAELAREDGRPRAADARADRGGARAVPDPLRHVRAAEPRRGGGARGDRPARHVRGGRRRLGADERARRRQGPRARPLERRADVLRLRRRLHPPEVRAADSTG